MNWDASTVGRQVREDLRTDPTGGDANETVRAAFGTKSHSTLLKRAGTMRRFLHWYQDTSDTRGPCACAFPLLEHDIWEYFKFLRTSRINEGKGFTTPATFLETVRFAKHTIDLEGCDDVLSSRRLLGFAAIEKRSKGPTRQAPALELEHMQRLHSILNSDASDIDRLGAGCMLLCIYARARWSDIRYVHHVEVESKRNGCLVVYTTEHKMAASGLKREQYLPLVVPCEGITNDNWMKCFLELYARLGLDIHKVPVGPLLPAPRTGGTFCARPLTTPEASRWMKELLRGTSNCDNLRAHSLKVTLLNWCARAGMDKEVRSVLGHHCSATSGSEVVYARHLQVRPIRKLQMLLRFVRIGMNLEEIAERGNIAGVTPGLQTPAPLFGIHGAGAVTPVFPVAASMQENPVEKAISLANEREDELSAKEELDDLAIAAASADSLSLFPGSIVGTGLIEIDSFSGSESESSSSDSDELQDQPVGPVKVYEEVVPEGLTFYRHVRSQRVHSVKDHEDKTACRMPVNRNYKLLDRVLHFRYPKCLKCFPKAEGRIRSREEAVGALDQAIERARKLQRS